MDAPSRTTPPCRVFIPSNFSELFTAWNHNPDMKLFAGGTEYIRNQANRILSLPPNIISLDKIEELRKISRTERYLVIGAMVKLNQIIELGRIVPEALCLCLEKIGSPQIRNIATIGGNICNPSRRLDASAPMIALDAQYELRSAKTSRWVQASRFSSLPGPPALAERELLTRIRIPLEPWSFTSYRKFHTPGSTESGGGILFIVKNQKNILTDIRVVYSGKTILREKNCETKLAGKQLPLSKKNAGEFVEGWRNYLSAFKGGNEKSIFGGDKESSPEMLKAQIINFIENALLSISE